MDTPQEGYEAVLTTIMRLVFNTWPDEAAYLVGEAWGRAMGEIIHDRAGQQHQQPGEWRSYDCDGYKFSIRRDSMGNLEVQREGMNDES